MIRYLVVRLAWSVALLFGLSLLFFALEQFTPNGACGPSQPYAPGAAQAMAACGRRFAWGQPLPVQYVTLMAHYLQGNAGPSVTTQSLGVMSAGGELWLLLSAILVQVPVAIVLGSAAALWPRSWFGRIFPPLAVVGRAVPTFWLGVMISLFPILSTRWTLGAADTAGKAIGPFPFFWSHAWFVALAHHPGPILGEVVPPFARATLVVVAAGILASALIVRDALAAELRQGHVPVARAGGLSRSAALRRALRASLPTAMTYATGQFAALLGAMAVAGYVLRNSFTTLAAIFTAAGAQNPVVAQGYFMGVTLAVLAGGVLSGVLQGMLDPRLRDDAAWVPPDIDMAAVRPARVLTTRLWFLASVALLILLGCVAIFAPLVSPESFLGYDYTRMLVPPHLAWPWQPEWRYLLGSDGTGRAMLMWVTYGARLPLTVGFVAALVATCLGLLLGSLRALPGALGACGGLVVQWASAVLTTPPTILLVFMLTIYLAHGQWTGIAVILGLIGWPSIARVVQSPVLLAQQRRAILVSRALGVTGLRLLWRALRPVTGPLLDAACRFAALAIALDAFMDFLGVGVAPNTTPTWGNAFMLNPSMLDPGPHGPNWWWPFFPGLCILLTALSLTGVGEGLHRLLGSPRVSRAATRWWLVQTSRTRMREDATPPITARQDSFNFLGAPVQDERNQ
jgi:peptide/nickel transport system permease protein